MKAASKKSLGDWGEKVAGEYLEKNGYRVMAANYRCKYGEIDLVCREGGVWCFVEVKTRKSSSYGAGYQAMTGLKQKHFKLAALSYMNQFSLFEVEARFDVVSIDFVSDDDYRIDLIKNAFQM